MLGANRDFNSLNLFAYCGNNPVTRADTGGTFFFDTVFDVISLVSSVVEVIQNPTDPWAWVGLAGDVVDLFPVVSGVGETTRIVKAGKKAVDTIDNLTDAADDVYDSVKLLDDIDLPDCFVAGTLISAAEGYIPIEEIKVGDYVWATDTETGETTLKRVVNTFINETTEVTRVTINGEEITSTQTHPYFVANTGWVLAKNLRAGDILVMLNGEKVVLELVQHEILESPVTTYNFEVADFHTYYVGKTDILVHNKCFRADLMGVTKMSNDMVKGYDAHHVFPQKFRQKFIDIVGNDWIDNPYYGAWWELHDHRKNAKAYNKAWEKFLDTNPTFDDVLDFGIKLSKEYGFTVNFK